MENSGMMQSGMMHSGMMHSGNMGTLVQRGNQFRTNAAIFRQLSVASAVCSGHTSDAGEICGLIFPNSKSMAG